MAQMRHRRDIAPYQTFTLPAEAGVLIARVDSAEKTSAN